MFKLVFLGFSKRKIVICISFPRLQIFILCCSVLICLNIPVAHPQCLFYNYLLSFSLFPFCFIYLHFCFCVQIGPIILCAWNCLLPTYPGYFESLVLSFFPPSNEYHEVGMGERRISPFSVHYLRSKDRNSFCRINFVLFFSFTLLPCNLIPFLFFPCTSLLDLSFLFLYSTILCLFPLESLSESLTAIASSLVDGFGLNSFLCC